MGNDRLFILCLTLDKQFDILVILDEFKQLFDAEILFVRFDAICENPFYDFS